MGGSQNNISVVIDNTPENRRRRREIIQRLNEETGLRAMAESQRVRESIISDVKAEIMKYRLNPEYRDNEGLRYLERCFDFGEEQQQEYREFRDIKSFLEERMRQ
jgi:hypothetical protein